MFPFFVLLFENKNKSGFFLFLRTAQITKPRKYELLECKSRHPCTVRNICTIHQKNTSTLLNHQHSSVSIPRRARLSSQCLLRKQLAHMLWLYIRQHKQLKLVLYFVLATITLNFQEGSFDAHIFTSNDCSEYVYTDNT